MYKKYCTYWNWGKIIKTLSNDFEEGIDFDYVSNPEFLREGSAVKDFLWPDRIIIGTTSDKAYEIMCDMYRPLYINKNPIKYTTVETAEMIKYASNSFLALKISYINEIANLCETVGADIHDVASAMGQDGRISDKFLHPGPGSEVLVSKRLRIINCYIKRKKYTYGDFKCCKKSE